MAVNCSPAACPQPTNLGAFNSDTASASVFWNGGNQTNWIVEYGPAGFAPGWWDRGQSAFNDTLMLIGLMSAASYDYLRPEQDCQQGTLSLQAGPFSFTTEICAITQRCTFTAELSDDFGDGWNGAEVTLFQNGLEVGSFGAGFTGGSALAHVNLPLCDGQLTYAVLSAGGGFPFEIGFDIQDPQGNVVATHMATSVSQGDTLAMFTTNCGGCPADSSYMMQSICDGDSLLIGSEYQSTTGLYVDSLSNANGCDSLVYVDLMVIPPVIVNKTDSICQGDSVLIAGVYQNTSGVYQEIFMAASGCDSICGVMDLGVLPDVIANKTDSICQGDSVMIGGIWRNTAGVYPGIPHCSKRVRFHL
ncbi:MAG: hypothetical protein U5L96_07145 [Owenweeksia sp.]|nr:hypothetical protein [Owenweeksia sp.]